MKEFPASPFLRLAFPSDRKPKGDRCGQRLPRISFPANFIVTASDVFSVSNVLSPLNCSPHFSQACLLKYESDSTPLRSTVLPCKDLRVPPEPALPSLVSLSLGRTLRLPATLIPMTSLLARCLCPCIGSCGEHAIQCPPLLNLTFKTPFRCQVLMILARSA